MRKVVLLLSLVLCSSVFALGDQIVPIGPKYYKIPPQQTFSFVIPDNVAWKEIECDYYTNLPQGQSQQFSIDIGNLNPQNIDFGIRFAKSQITYDKLGYIDYINSSVPAHLYVKNGSINSNVNIYAACHLVS